MKSTKTFNNISSKLKAQIPKLKPKEVVTFQMLNGTPNPEPDEKERSKSPVLYGKIQVQTNFRIYDEHLTDEDGKEVGGYVDVGCVDSWVGDRPDKFRLLVPGMGEYTQFQGKFSLMGGNIKDEELYEILWLSPERQGSPCQDSSVATLFKMIDLKSESKSTFDKVGRLRKSLEIANNISEADARKVMAALNQPNYQDKEVLMAKIGELARDKYDLFIQTYESPETSLKAEMKEALDAGIISHDLRTGKVSIGDVLLTTLKIDNSTSFVTEFTKWINGAENGKDVLGNIRKQLAGKKELVTK